MAAFAKVIKALSKNKMRFAEYFWWKEYYEVNKFIKCLTCRIEVNELLHLNNLFCFRYEMVLLLIAKHFVIFAWPCMIALKVRCTRILTLGGIRGQNVKRPGSNQANSISVKS